MRRCEVIMVRGIGVMSIAGAWCKGDTVRRLDGERVLGARLIRCKGDTVRGIDAILISAMVFGAKMKQCVGETVRR